MQKCQEFYTTKSKQTCGTLEYKIKNGVVSSFPKLGLDIVDIYANEFCSWKLLPKSSTRKLYARFQIYYNDEVEKIHISCSLCKSLSNSSPARGELIQIETADMIKISYISPIAQSVSGFKVVWTYLGNDAPSWSSDYQTTTVKWWLLICILVVLISILSLFSFIGIMT
jgi:hypothetical protein